MSRKPVESGFVQATSENIPSVDGEMLADFYFNNKDFMLSESSGEKNRRAMRSDYAADAVGYVRLRRQGGRFFVKAKVTPEHRVRADAYDVEVLVNEISSTIISCKCLDCAASQVSPSGRDRFECQSHTCRQPLPPFMQIMGSWCSKCYYSCCGESGEINLHPQLLEKQRVTTVRRISSVGITVVNDDGEEREIPRHSSILQSYSGLTVPLSVQPGVTREDVASRIKTLPTISETPPTKQKTKSWKKALTGSKGDFSLDRTSCEKGKPKADNDIRLTLFKQVNANNEVSLSQDDIVSRRSKPSDPAWQPLRRPSYSSSPNLFAMKTSDKSSQHMLSLAEYSRINLENSDDKRSSWMESHSLEALSVDEESEASKLAKQYGLDLSLYVQHDISSTNESSCTVTEPLVFWQERSYGTVDAVVSIDSLQKLLTVTVDGMRGLSGSGPQRQVYPISFKISVLNDKKNIKTSKKLAGSSNPKVNQTFLFHVKDINSRGFRISVHNAEFLGRHDAIGHALFNFRDATKEPRSFPLKLGRPSTLDSCSAVVELIFSLKETLNVTVVRVMNIPQKYRHNRVYVKQSYFSLSKKTKERVSSVCWKGDHSETIAFDHSAKFKIDTSGQKHSYVMISLKVCSSKLAFRKNDKTIGRVYLGPCFYYDDGSLTPWGKVVLRNENFAGSFQMYL